MRKPKYLIKSFCNSDSDQYVRDFINKGELYTNTTTYYRYLAYKEKYEKYKYYDKIDWRSDSSKGISDIRESLFLDCAFVYTNYPIYCMYSVYDEDIYDGFIHFNGKAIEEFVQNRHSKFVVVDYEKFCQQFKNNIMKDYVMRKVEYGSVSKDDQIKLYNDSKQYLLLFVKSLRYKHQQEFRFVIFEPQKEASILTCKDSCDIRYNDGSKYNGKSFYIGSLQHCSTLFDYNSLSIVDKDNNMLIPLESLTL